MGSQIVSRVQSNNTPIVSLQQYQFGGGAGVLSVRIKNDKKGPQTGDVVLELDDAVISLLEWDPTYEYKKNNICLVEDGESGRKMIFRAIVDYPTMGEFVREEWEEIDTVDIIAEDFKPFFPYEKDQICIVNHMFYRAKESFVSGDAFDIADWEEIGGATIDDYQMGMHVNKWQPIIFDGSLYRAKEDLTTSVAGNIYETWPLDKDKFEEIRSGDSTYVLKEVDFAYSESDRDLSFLETYYQLNSQDEIEKEDHFVHDETIEIIKTTSASGIQLQIKVPTFGYDKLGVIRGAKFLPDPHYRGEMAAQGNMDAIKDLRIGDFCDRLDTNTEWTFNGDLWVNTGQPINTTPHEKIPDNYVQADSDGFGFINITSDNLLRLATDSEASARVSNEVATSPLHLSLYGGNLRQFETTGDLPTTGLAYDLYYILNERRFYRWNGTDYTPLDAEIEDFIPNYNYTKDTIIVFNGKLYRAKEDLTSGNTFNPDDWEQIGRAVIDDFESDHQYTTGDIIYYNGVIYRVTNNFISGPNFESDGLEALTPDTNDTLKGGITDKYIDSVNGHDNHEAGNSFDDPYLTLEFAISEIKNLIRGMGSSVILHFATGKTYTFTQSDIFSNLEGLLLTASIPVDVIYNGVDTLLLDSTHQVTFENINLQNNAIVDTFITLTNNSNLVRIKDSIVSSTTDIEKLISSSAKRLYLDNVTLDNNAIYGLETKDGGTTELYRVTVNVYGESDGAVFLNDNGLLNTVDRILGIPDDLELFSNKYNVTGFYRLDYLPNFQPDFYYAKDTQIAYYGLNWRAKENFVSAQTWNSADWEMIEPTVREYESDEFYPAGTLIYRDGEVFKATDDVYSTTESDFIVSEWERIADITGIREFKPNWSYKEGDIIYQNGIIYVAKDDFTSNDAFDIDNWDLVVSNAGMIQDFIPNQYYPEKAPIRYDNKLYRALEGFTAESDFSPLDWEFVTGPILQDYLSEFFYQQNELIVHNGVMYRSKYSKVSPMVFDFNDWEEVGGSKVKEYESNHFYSEGTLVVYNGRVYRSLKDFTSTTTFDPNDWAIVGPDKVRDYEAGQSYRDGELTVYKGRLYRAKQDIDNTTLTFDISQWEPVDESSIRNFVPDNFYPKDAVISYNQIIYRAKTDFVTESDFDPDNWEQIGGAGVAEFEPNHYYNKGTLITYNNKVYYAKDEFTSGNEFDPLDWVPVGATSLNWFESDKFYGAGDTIVEDDRLYRAVTDFTSGPEFMESDWEWLITGYDYWHGDANDQKKPGIYIVDDNQSTNLPSYYGKKVYNGILTVQETASGLRQGFIQLGDFGYYRYIKSDGTWSKWEETVQGNFVQSVAARPMNAAQVDNTNKLKPVIWVKEATDSDFGTVRLATPTDMILGDTTAVVTPDQLIKYVNGWTGSDEPDSDWTPQNLNDKIDKIVAGGTQESDSTLITDVRLEYNEFYESDLEMVLLTADPFTNKQSAKTVDVPHRTLFKEGLMLPEDTKEMIDLRTDIEKIKQLGHYVGTVDEVKGTVPMYLSTTTILRNGGRDYTVGDVLKVYGNKGDLSIRVSKIDAGTGAVTEFVVLSNYLAFTDIAGTGVPFEGGSGSGFTADITTTSPKLSKLADLNAQFPAISANDYAYVRYDETDDPAYRQARYIWTSIDSDDEGDEWVFDSFISNEYIAQAENITLTYPGFFGVIKGSRLNDGTDDDACYIDENGVPRVNGYNTLATMVEGKVSKVDLATVAFTGNYKDLNGIPEVDDSTTTIRKTTTGDLQGYILTVGAGGDISNPDSFELVDPAQLFASVGFVQKINDTLLPDANGNVVVAKELTTAQYDSLSLGDRRKPILYFETDSNKSLVEEAPVDNRVYERRNGAWEQTNLFMLDDTLVQFSNAPSQPTPIAGRDIYWFEQL